MSGIIHHTAGLDWLLSSGGNLIVLPAELAPLWQGTESSDFDQACDIEESVGLLPVGAGNILALGGEPLATAVHSDPVQPEVIYLLRWLRGDDKAVCTALSLLPELPFTAEDATLALPSGKLIVTDAASARGEKGLYLSATLGTYSIVTCHYLPDTLTYLVLHRLTRMEPHG